MKIGIEVALIIFCPYHSRPLLCGFPNNEWVIKRDTPKSTATGSGTPFVNIDLQQFRDFSSFIQERFDVPIELSRPLVMNFMGKAIKHPDLQITHDRNSAYRENKTGFNWKQP